MKEKFWHKSYPPGVNRSIDYEKVTIPETLNRSAQKFTLGCFYVMNS